MFDLKNLYHKFSVIPLTRQNQNVSYYCISNEMMKREYLAEKVKKPLHTPTDVLFIGDSMIKNFQVYGHPVRVWKFSYPGATAEALHDHFLTEDLPGEILVGTVMISLGTNDLSRSRDRYRTLDEVYRYLRFFVLRVAKMYPYASIVFSSILPRVDCDNERVKTINSAMQRFMLRRERRYQYYDCYNFFLNPNGQVNLDYYRDSKDDSVHLSDSGTQVYQDVLNRLMVQFYRNMMSCTVDCKLLLWQKNWEYYNMFYVKGPGTLKNAKLDKKRITNYTSVQHAELLAYEDSIKTTLDY